MRGKRTGTKTSSFGTSKREGHDSSLFYSRKLYPKQPVRNVLYVENRISKRIIDKVHCKDSRDMPMLPDTSIHLMVTSPPYNVGKDYDEDMSLDEYRALLRQVFSETYKKLVPGGRACVNVANIGRSPYIPLHSYIVQDMLGIGYKMRGEIIWDKAAGAGVSTAWGSFGSASNPTLRDTHEYILVFSKDIYKREACGRENTISKEDFLDWTKSIWRFSPESAHRVNHPAPFPEELPYRLIQLYTFKDDVILDPFCGSGTTCVTALKTGRHFVGFDIDREYVKIARERILKYRQKLEAEQAQLPLQPL
jgi:site-specific DNA-methyltransferase (adenine-specific)